MNYKIKVQKSPEYLQLGNHNLLIKKFDTEKEFQAVFSLYNNKSKRRIDWLKSLLIPVRTDTIDHFCKDFFLPGLFNEALKTKDLASKIFLIILMPIYDVITFPCRLITVIPRCIYNAIHPKEAHPFYKYLINEGVAAKDLREGHVCIVTKQLQNNWIIQEKEETFNFIELPVTVSSSRNEIELRALPNISLL